MENQPVVPLSEKRLGHIELLLTDLANCHAVGFSDPRPTETAARELLAEVKRLQAGSKASNSMPAAWCAARVAEARALVARPNSAADLEALRTAVIELLSQLDNPPAAEVVKAEVVQAQVFPPACPRCTQQLNLCVCPALF